MQQLYAEIKKSSKYAHQADWCRTQGYGYPFKVRIAFDKDGYSVKGGVGGQYRLEDVNLYVLEDGKKIRVRQRRHQKQEGPGGRQPSEARPTPRRSTMQAQTPEVSAEKGTTTAITSAAQLTQLLENVRCLHDISAELIAADVFSQLAELHQQGEADEWTHAKPTQAGAYWIRGNLLMEPALVQVKNDRGQLWCNLHMSTTEPDFRHGFCIAQLSDQFEWIGPIGRPGAGGAQ